MDRKRILALLLFGCLVIAGMFYGTSVMIGQYEVKPISDGTNTNADDETRLTQNESTGLSMDGEVWTAGSSQASDYTGENTGSKIDDSNISDMGEADKLTDDGYLDPDLTAASLTAADEEMSFADNGSGISDNNNTAADSNLAAEGEDIVPGSHIDAGDDNNTADESMEAGTGSTDKDSEKYQTGNGGQTDEDKAEAVETSGNAGMSDNAEDKISCLDLIYDSTKVDYKVFIPTMVTDDSKLETALDIDNPGIDIDASAAVLFDANSGDVLYYKEPVKAVFPASTAKLLTALVAIDWCKKDEEVIIGNEIKMVASDSTKARIKCGQVLTIRNLLEGMLLPSGNDAAYSLAAYVGRKSLQQPEAREIEAVEEFVKLMNEKAAMLGTVNSCFKTPDGYDAIGQYTTAYDMGIIGLEAVKNDTILEITGMSSSRNVFVSGEDVTWENTNSLINRYSGRYYSPCFGLKTGTSTMAGRCLLAAGKKSGRVVLCVVMDSTAQGRWEDAIKLMDYGLNN